MTSNAPAEHAAPRRSRPGAVVAAAVLAFVQAGLVLYAVVAILLSLGERDGGGPAGLFLVLGFAGLVCAALLIAGGVVALAGKGRLIRAAASICLLLSLIWAITMLVSTAEPPSVVVVSAIFLPLLFAVLPILILVFASDRLTEGSFADRNLQERWLTPLVWLVIAAVVALVVYLSLSPGGQPLLYNRANEHSWLVDMIFQPTSVMQKIVVMFVAIALFLVVMGVILWAVDRTSVPKGVLIAGFLGPVVIALASGLLWSAIKTIIQSFQRFDQFGTEIGWAGWANYGHIFTTANQDMLINTVLWIFIVPIVATAFGLIYAVLVDRTRVEAAAKALVFLPMAISMVAASVIWKYVYYQPAPPGEPQIGLLNALVSLVGGDPVNWTAEFPTGTFSLIVVMIWIQTGLAMTLLSASIKAIPDEIIEAARIDGATGWRLFRSITVPSIRPTMVVVLTTLAIASLKTFDIVNVMGNNLGVNDILANAFYQWMSVQQPGWAGAAAVIIFVVVIPVIAFNVRQMRKSEAIR